jgi:hypothetical protein
VIACVDDIEDSMSIHPYPGILISQRAFAYMLNEKKKKQNKTKNKKPPFPSNWSLEAQRFL